MEPTAEIEFASPPEEKGDGEGDGIHVQPQFETMDEDDAFAFEEEELQGNSKAVVKRLAVFAFVLTLLVLGAGLYCKFTDTDCSFENGELWLWGLFLVGFFVSFAVLWVVARLLTLLMGISSTLSFVHEIFVVVERQIHLLLWGLYMLFSWRAYFRGDVEEEDISWFTAFVRTLIYVDIAIIIKAVVMKLIKEAIGSRKLQGRIRWNKKMCRIIKRLQKPPKKDVDPGDDDDDEEEDGRNGKKEPSESARSKFRLGKIRSIAGTVKEKLTSKTLKSKGGLEPGASDLVLKRQGTDEARNIVRNVDYTGKGYILKGDLTPWVREKDGLLDRVFRYMDRDKDDQVSVDDCITTCIRVFMNQRDLHFEVQGKESIYGVVEKIVSVIVIISIVVLNWFGVNIIALMIPFGAIFIAVGLAFSETVRLLVEALLIIYIARPFEIGDIICLDDGPELIVKEVGFLNTLMKSLDGRGVWVPNTTIAESKITNYRRSEEVVCNLELLIGVETNMEQLQGLQRGIREYLEARPNLWKSKFLFAIADINDDEQLVINIQANLKSTWQDHWNWRSARSDLLVNIQYLISELQIELEPKPDPVKVELVEDRELKIMQEQFIEEKMESDRLNADMSDHVKTELESVQQRVQADVRERERVNKELDDLSRELMDAKKKLSDAKDAAGSRTRRRFFGWGSRDKVA